MKSLGFKTFYSNKYVYQLYYPAFIINQKEVYFKASLIIFRATKYSTGFELFGFGIGIAKKG